MRTALSVAFVALVPVVASAVELNATELYTIEYTFTVGKSAPTGLLDEIETLIGKQLVVEPFEDPQRWAYPKTGTDCAKITKERKPGNVTYICRPTKEVVDAMADVYYRSLDAHSPLNEVSSSATASLYECSTGFLQGCKNTAHLHAHKCYIVTDPATGFLVCRHQNFFSDPTHGCY